MEVTDRGKAKKYKTKAIYKLPPKPNSNMNQLPTNSKLRPDKTTP
jgi:hypothetical protein